MSAQATAANVSLTLFEEDTFATIPGVPAGFVMPVSSVTLGATRNLIETTCFTSTRDASQPVRGNTDVSGSFDHCLQLDPFGLLLKHAIGAPTTTGVGPYTHTYKVGALPTGLTVEVAHPDLTPPVFMRYSGVKIDSWTIRATSEGPVTVSFDTAGAVFSKAATALDATPTTYTDPLIDQFSAAIEEGGSPIATVTDLEITFSNNIDRDVFTVGGGGTRACLDEDRASVSGTLTALFTDATLCDKADQFTESSLKLTYTSGTSSLEILIPELVFQFASPQITGPGGILLTLQFQGYFLDSAEGSIICVTLINDVASY